MSQVHGLLRRGVDSVSKIRVLTLALFFSMSFAGLAYLLYLQLLYPTLIPGYGGGERFSLTNENNHSFQIPWFAHSRLHLTLQANDTVELHVDGEYVGDYTHYDFVIEPGREVPVLLKSSSTVSGMFTARQEIPLEKQVLALGLLLTGLSGTAIFARIGRSIAS